LPKATEPDSEGLVSENALVSSKRSLFTGWPETGLEEIDGDLLEEDFWLEIISG
jgi:hypothetical protein